MSKTRVINLIGASGSGKTTIAREFEKEGYNVIQSYTTRPPRYDGEWGHTFISNPLEIGHYKPTTLIEYMKDGETKEYKGIIAYFNSYNSGHHYFATDKQVVRGKDNIYVVDPAGAKMVKDCYKDTEVEVITIYLQTDWKKRAARMTTRGDNPSDILDRLEKDDEIFEVVKCDYTVSANKEVSTTTKWIIETLEG